MSVCAGGGVGGHEIQIKQRPMNADRPDCKNTDSLLVGVVKTPTDRSIIFVIVLKTHYDHEGLVQAGEVRTEINCCHQQ